MVHFAEKNLLRKAAARPDLVRQVIAKAQRDGIVTAVEAVRGRLDRPVLLGYSAAGTVIEGEGPYQPGQRVACSGAGYANHAEFIAVPLQLCAPLPDGVTFVEGAFATVGAIALHGLRTGRVELGGRVGVIGLGLLGQIAIQLSRAAGCQVCGVEPNIDRADRARALGADFVVAPEEAQSAVRQWTRGAGLDAVLITADSPADGPVQLAGAIARDRGTVVAVGAVGMKIPRRTYYEKELSFLISRSLGPGRYDPTYEIEGRDYPIGYVRWTEGRNLSAFLELIARGAVNVSALVSHNIPIGDGQVAYDIITGRKAEPFLGVALTYPDSDAPPSNVITSPAVHRQSGRTGVRVGMLGAGAFAESVLLPAFAGTQARLIGIASRTGVTARTCADRFHFRYCTTDESKIVNDTDIDIVVIATRHDLHARQVLEARARGKHVFVEKPLCLTTDELEQISQAYETPGPMLMVGYNRRFAPLAQTLATFFGDVTEPLCISYRVNAGFVPSDHWIHDPAIGGGRIIGEVCHFVDFVSWLQRGVPSTVSGAALPDSGRYSRDNVVGTLTFARGGVASIVYTAAGESRLGKERVEVHGGGRSAVLTDFRILETFNDGKRHVHRLRFRQDKGHKAECAAFISAVRSGGAWPIPLADILATTKATLLLNDAILSTGRRA